jgi:dimethylargininase
MIAIVRRPSPNMHSCERTFVECLPIDQRAAVKQHSLYCEALKTCGCELVSIEASRELPDCAFVEDTAVVLDEVAVLSSMGARSRAAETADVEPVLAEYRRIERLPAGATLEGGDVLRVGRTLLVGQSKRTNAAGAEALANVAGRHGYQLRPIAVRHALHLKTGCTALPDGRLLVNRVWLHDSELSGFDLIDLPPLEPWGANVVVIGDTVMMLASNVRTAELVEGLGFRVMPVDISEFAKAEGGVTCLSLIFSQGRGDELARS